MARGGPRASPRWVLATCCVPIARVASSGVFDETVQNKYFLTVVISSAAVCLLVTVTMVWACRRRWRRQRAVSGGNGPENNEAPQVAAPVAKRILEMGHSAPATTKGKAVVMTAEEVPPWGPEHYTTVSKEPLSIPDVVLETISASGRVADALMGSWCYDDGAGTFTITEVCHGKFLYQEDIRPGQHAFASLWPRGRWLVGVLELRGQAGDFGTIRLRHDAEKDAVVYNVLAPDDTFWRADQVAHRVHSGHERSGLCGGASEGNRAFGCAHGQPATAEAAAAADVGGLAAAVAPRVRAAGSCGCWGGGVCVDPDCECDANADRDEPVLCTEDTTKARALEDQEDATTAVRFTGQRREQRLVEAVHGARPLHRGEEP